MIKTQYVIIVALSVLFGAIACFLIKIAGETVAAEEKIELQNSEAGTGAEKTSAEKVYIAAIFLLNLLAGCYMRAVFGESLITIANMMALNIVLWSCAWSDWKVFLIPNRILIIGLILRVVLIAIESIAAPGEIKYVFVSSMMTATALFVVSMLCRLISPKSIGFGDVKLLMLMGFYLKGDRILGAVFLSMIAAFFFSLYLVIVKKAGRQTEIPFAPLLLVGQSLAIFLTSV